MAANIAVYGLYKNRSNVEEAVEALKVGGFRNTDISVLFPENQGSKDFAIEKDTKAPEGAVAGGGSGAARRTAANSVSGKDSPSATHIYCRTRAVDAPRSKAVGRFAGKVSGKISGRGPV